MGRPTNTHRPSVALRMQPVEAAWTGAFIDADGSVTVYKPRPRSSDDLYVVVKVTQREIDPIATLLRITGVGHVNLIRSHSVGPNPYIWRWQVNAQGDVADILQQITPYSAKAQKALPAVAHRM